MTLEGYKKKDIQRKRQIVEQGVSVSSSNMASTSDNQNIPLGFAAEKMTLVTTGDLVVAVQAKIGAGNSNTSVNANTTVATTVTSHMFSSLQITYTSGSGRLIILAR